LMALDAYHASLNGKPAPVIDGLTGDQRVFLGFAQVWRSKDKPDALKVQLASNPHSPASARASTAIRNVDAWYEAFGVKPGDKLYIPPEQRARIW
jgi:putative endopeptidase